LGDIITKPEVGVDYLKSLKREVSGIQCWAIIPMADESAEERIECDPRCTEFGREVDEFVVWGSNAV
jgi:hypothetical protein